MTTDDVNQVASQLLERHLQHEMAHFDGDALVHELLVLREQRRHLIDRMLEQPIYRDLIASLMYEGLLRYVYEENLLSRRVPGVTSALRMSSRVLSKAMSGLDEVWKKSICH